MDLSSSHLDVATAFFGLFGYLYVGGGQYFLFTKYFPQVANKVAPALEKVMSKDVAFGVGCMSCDVFAHMPFVYMPTFYSLAQVTYRGDEGKPVLTNIQDGLAKWRSNLMEDFLMSAAIFAPVTLI